MPVIFFSGGLTEPVSPIPTVHFKASSETIYNDGDTLTIVTNRGSAGAGCNLTTVVGTPQYKTNIMSGQPAYYGTVNEAIYAQNIGSGTMISAANGTMLIAWKAVTAVNSYPFFMTEIGVAVRAVFETIVTTQQARGGNYDGSLDSTAALTMTNNTPYIGTWLHTGGNVSFGMNDTRTASLVSAASGNTSIAAGDDLFMLGSTASLFMDGYVAEVVAWNTALTEADRQSWERWLAHKYGITLPY